MIQNDDGNSNFLPLARQVSSERSRGGRSSTYALARVSGRGENLISPSFLVWVLQQWWKIGIPLGLLFAAVAGAAVMYFYVPKYKATALLTIEDATPYLAFSGKEMGASYSYIATQTELLRSPVVLESVLRRPEVASMAELSGEPNRVGYLQQHVSVARIGASELYNVMFDSYTARDAANVANAVVAEYLLLQAKDETQGLEAVVRLLEEERLRRSAEVERLRKRVKDVAKDVTGTDPFSGSVTDVQRALNPVSTLFQSLAAADVDREVLQAKLSSMTDPNVADQDPLESNGWLEVEVDNQDEIRERQAAIQDIQARMEAIKNRAREGRLESIPSYKMLKEALAISEKELADSRQRLRGMVLEHRKKERQLARDQQVAQLAEELSDVETRKELLSQRYADQVREMQFGDEKSVELEFVRAELAREDKVFSLIATRKLALQTEMRAPARVKLTRPADVPVTPDQPVPYKMLFLACSLAFLAPFALAAGKEVLVRRISDIDQLAEATKLRVLGEISALPVRQVAISPKKLSGRLRRESYVFAESINSLRTNLTVAEILGSQHVIAVTSSVAGEGKTSVATSLAMSIASATDTHTLIIDADMRSPDVATILKTHNRPGLFEVLTNQCQLDDAIHHVSDSNLYMIPAGRATKNPHSILGVAATKELLDQLRGRFQSIIIDTPPILGASEALVLAKASDTALFCTLCDVSRVRQVRLAIERLEHAGVNLAGAVLSGTTARRYAYVYGYYENRGELND